MKYRFFIPTALASSLALAFAGAAQGASDTERLQTLEQRLESSLALIEQLNRRLAELERPAPALAQTAQTAQAAQAAQAAASPDTQRRIESVERSLGEMSAALASAKPVDDTGVPLHGFLYIGWAQRSSNAPAGTRNGLQLGSLDLYLTPQFGPQVRSLIELVFEYGEHGGLATDLERVQLGYVINDGLVLWGGRFHTPFGYWNTAFHHGAQIQTSITRPRFVAFEDQGGILPGHTVGAWLNGKQATAWGRLGYDVFVGNGNRISEGVLDFNPGGDDNSSPSIGFNLSLSPKAVPGLTLGLHGLQQTVAGENADASASGRARTRFLGGYAYFENDDWELIGEYYRFRNRDLDNGGLALGSWAGFVQAAYNVAPRWATFVRAEKAALNGADPYFALQDSGISYQQWSAGLRFDLDPRAALKLQVDRNRDQARGNTTVNALRAQYAIRF